MTQALQHTSNLRASLNELNDALQTLFENCLNSFDFDATVHQSLVDLRHNATKLRDNFECLQFIEFIEEFEYFQTFAESTDFLSHIYLQIIHPYLNQVVSDGKQYCPLSQDETIRTTLKFAGLKVDESEKHNSNV